MNIREFAQHTGLTAHTLRYYERAGLFGEIARGANGHRIYDAGDARWVAFLQRLRDTGMPIREMQRYRALREPDHAGRTDLLTLLEQHADQVAASLRSQHEHLARLREQIAVYRAELSGKPRPRFGPG